MLKPPCFIDEACQGHSSSGCGSWSKEGSRKWKNERGRLRCLLKFNKDLWKRQKRKGGVGGRVRLEVCRAWKCFPPTVVNNELRQKRRGKGTEEWKPDRKTRLTEGGRGWGQRLKWENNDGAEGFENNWDKNWCGSYWSYSLMWLSQF